MDKTKKRGSTAEKVFYLAVVSSFIFSLLYIVLNAALDDDYRENTEYKIMIFQSLFGLVIINLPLFLRKYFNWEIPSAFSIAFILFLFGAIFAGEVLQFYYRIPIWDDILHLSSSMMAAVLGFSVVSIICKSADATSSPFLTALFSATFSISIGVVWEIYEFVFDGILSLNMQKFATVSNVPSDILKDLSGRDALMDTMYDLITDVTGALLISVIGYVSLKRNGKLPSAFIITVKGSKT